MRRNGRDREFRNVDILRDEPNDAAQPEAGAKSIDQMGELRAMIGGGKARLHRFLRLGHQCCEPHHIKAEAWIADVSKRGKPLGE